MLEVSGAQLEELRHAMHHAGKAHVRRKATAIWNLAQGRSRAEVSAFLDVSLTSLSAWAGRYRRWGIAGFAIQSGRGRPRRADPREIETYLRQSPRAFGLHETRWTLAALSKVVPSLKGFSASGVRQALQRHGFHYKRGQPHLTSPDPLYEEKRGDSWQRFEKQAKVAATS